MLSDAIRELDRTFREYEHSGLQMSDEAVQAHRRIFKAWAIEAANMETRLDQLGPHVPFLPEQAGGATVIPFRRPQ